MKQLITILSLCLFTMAGTQNAQAQTKEETIAWIKEKLEKYGGMDNSSPDIARLYLNVNVSPCKISFTTKYENGKEYKRSFNPRHAKKWSNNRHNGFISADAEIIKYDSGSMNTLWVKNGESDIQNV